MNTRLFWTMLKETFNNWLEDKAMRLAAALALYSILSLAPLLVITIKIVSAIFGEEAASGQVQQQVQGLIGSAGSQAIADMIAHASQPGHGILATIISVVILLFTASGVFAELQDSMDTVWEVKPKPNQGIWATVRARFLSVGMVLALAFLLLVSLFVSTALTSLAGWLSGGVQFVSYIVDFLVSLGVITVVLAMIFKFLPDVKIAWSDVWLGAAITAALFKVGQYALALYFRYGSTTSAYGAAGSFVAVLLWAYYSAQIMFFGAEFTQVYLRRRGKRIEPSANAVKVTEEDRAQQGIPDRGRVASQAAGAHRRPVRITPPAAPPAWAAAYPAGVAPSHYEAGGESSPLRQALLAGSGLAAGVVAGALGARQIKTRPARQARAAHLERRLDSLEARLRRIATVTRHAGMPVEPRPSIWKEFREGFEEGKQS